MLLTKTDLRTTVKISALLSWSRN